MHRSVIVVGLNPARERNLKKNTLTRLTEWLDFLELPMVTFTNLSPDVDWDFDLKKVDASFLSQQLKTYPKVLALGGKVSDYLAKYLHTEHFKLPHPSYRNRLLNDREFERRILIECKNYLKG